MITEISKLFFLKKNTVQISLFFEEVNSDDPHSKTSSTTSATKATTTTTTTQSVQKVSTTTPITQQHDILLLGQLIKT